MDKRYQIFVSSTYEDLQDERKEVMQALLELDCIPAGMELFPASNDDQWTLIKRMIDDCDYYILILGGRYGSTNREGMSYTEMEYRYAIETNKPIISFLHKNPEEISSKKTEKLQDGKDKLNKFREFSQMKMTKYWDNPSNLGSVVSRSMIRLIKDYPAIGWIKADNIVDNNSIKEILKLKKENEQLKNQIEENRTQAPKGTATLANGEDKIKLRLQCEWNDVDYNIFENVFDCDITWNQVFASIAPHLIYEASESTIKILINSLLKESIQEYLNSLKDGKGFNKFKSIFIVDIDFQLIKVQLRALGLIQKGIKTRSVQDNLKYWALTDYGDFMMTQLIAIKK